MRAIEPQISGQQLDSISASVTDVEIAKTNTSYLVIYQDTY